MIAYIPADNAKDTWHTIEPLVQKSLRGIESEVTPADILEGVIDRNLMLLVVEPNDPIGVIILSHKRTPQIAFLEIDLIGGTDMAKWMTEAHNAIILIAKKLGVSKVKALGRKGWHKHAAALGFQPKRTLFEMEI
jgi:hypothetical protein